jgi:hypothetical protein
MSDKHYFLQGIVKRPVFSKAPNGRRHRCWLSPCLTHFRYGNQGKRNPQRLIDGALMRAYTLSGQLRIG